MRTLLSTAVVVVLLSFTGCMPANLQEALAWKIEQDRATDAKSQPVKSMPYLRVDDYLLDRLNAVAELPDDQARQRILELFDHCHGLAVDEARVEIDRLSSAAMQEIWHTCFRTEAVPADLRETIRTRYIKLLDDGYQAFVRDTAQDSSVDHMRNQVALIRDRAAPSIKEHRGSGLFLELVRASHPARPESMSLPTAESVVYEPGRVASDPVKSAFDDATTRGLLERFAPRIVQERPAKSNYPAHCDMIGSVRLLGRPDQVNVVIQTDSPSVYAYTRRAVIQDREHLQLVYCYWFPEHPPVKRGDPEAGPIDGATLRLTLDSHSRPAFIEVVQNCGCHFRCFASRQLDEAARREFGAPTDRAVSALTRPDSGGMEIIVDDLFDLESEMDTGPIVFSPAATHVPVRISFSNVDLREQTIQGRQSYDLHAYELLENMPTDFGRASMFGADGLVHNAGRLEGWLLAGTGMLSAGQPRQRGTQLICWDKRSFDDPHLLEQSFRLPKDF